jgi:DUSAM domain-containing protein
MGTESSDWSELKKLAEAHEKDSALPLEPHGELIARVAAQVGLEPATDLASSLKQARAAIKDGSKRLMVAITAAQSAYAAGDFERSRSLLQAALDAEPIAYYREILKMELARRS